MVKMGYVGSKARIRIKQGRHKCTIIQEGGIQVKKGVQKQRGSMLSLNWESAKWEVQCMGEHTTPKQRENII